MLVVAERSAWQLTCHIGLCQNAFFASDLGVAQWPRGVKSEALPLPGELCGSGKLCGLVTGNIIPNVEHPTGARQPTSKCSSLRVLFPIVPQARPRALQVNHIIKRCHTSPNPPPEPVFKEGVRSPTPAGQVAEAWGYDTASILSVPSASVDRGVASPPDISMDCSRLAAALPGVQPTPLRAALADMRPPSSLPVQDPVVSAGNPELAKRPQSAD